MDGGRSLVSFPVVKDVAILLNRVFTRACLPMSIGSNPPSSSLLDDNGQCGGSDVSDELYFVVIIHGLFHISAHYLNKKSSKMMVRFTR